MNWKQDIKVDGNITGKGRNGYFKIREFEVWTNHQVGRVESDIYVEVYSSKRGNSAPLKIQGLRSEVIGLLEEMLTAAKSVI